jgi:hypothetical protein
MNYVDATLIRLAEPATRLAVFDDAALEQLLTAAYDTDLTPVEGPFQPVFDELRLGLAVSRFGVIEGTWSPVGGIERMEARFQTFGLGQEDVIRVDALWRGSIIARTAPATSRIIEVETAWPSLGAIDAEIVAVLGALPAQAQALEQERRARLIARIRASLDQPAAFTDAIFDDWTKSVGATSVSDLLTRFQGTVFGGGAKLTFSPPDPTPPSPVALPVAAAMMIRDAGFSIAQLLMESKMARERLDRMGLERTVNSSFRLRQPLLIVWVAPISIFDDADWPGGAQGMNDDQLRAARRAQAGAWLAREGIGLVATNP